jgi:hypothetical protein
MTWSASPYTTKEPLLVDALMLAPGKSLYLACEFERKCQYVLRLLNIVETFKEAGEVNAFLVVARATKDKLIGRTIADIVTTGALTPEEIDGLEKARIARNCIAHDNGKIGQLTNPAAKYVTS